MPSMSHRMAAMRHCRHYALLYPHRHSDRLQISNLWSSSSYLLPTGRFTCSSMGLFATTASLTSACAAIASSTGCTALWTVSSELIVNGIISSVKQSSEFSRDKERRSPPSLGLREWSGHSSTFTPCPSIW